MMKKLVNNKSVCAILSFCVLLEALLEFLLHRRFIFLWDDLWYSTNLVTGKALTGITDIFESQYWHYFNWGGRSISHSVLQLTLMGGELFADVLNMIVTFTLCYLICEIAGRKSIKYYCLSFFLLISLNTDIKLSMFWQSGSANYLYSTNWILLFLLLYLRYVKNPDSKKIPGLSLLMLPLGLITGWSNENMGPACAVTAFIIIVYCFKFLKRKAPVWMWSGAVTSFIGSVILILAPGNFVRKTHVEEISLWETLYDRFFSMLAGGMSYLFPSLLCLILFLFIYLKVGNKLEPYQITLMLTAILAYGAMILSPTFPNRAAFGLMVLCIILILSFIEGIEQKNAGYKKYISVFVICMWLIGMFTLTAALKLPL